MKSKLKEYLDSRKMTAYEFAKISGLSFDTVRKAMDAKPVMKRVSRRIVRYTKGEVTEKDIPTVLLGYVCEDTVDTSLVESASGVRAQVI